MRKIVFPASIVASAATAFGLGAIAFNSPNAPAGANPLPQPTATVTAPALEDDAQDVADDTTPTKAAESPNSTPTTGKHAKTYTGSEKVATTPSKPKHAKPKATTKPKAGSKGPIKDAQDDGKVLDDIGKTFLPNGVGVHVPDELLPFPGPGYTGPPTTIETQEDADTFAQSSAYNPADVVSGPNIITDPDKPWFHFPTGTVTAQPAESTPVVSTPVEAPEPVVTSPVTTEPVRTGGLVTGTRPRFF
ncbi:hypothetical protein HOV12_gp44 [Streptomyces phage Lilbooboo]|uniref:Uncharacterized protein n=1 Tax=Streptomyces phage Lilbooboo TaxID=2510571 RepID=A0A411B321_9CAUD|nr:hypothetical protein HOV12_gp44 [Streptomyces phage Lilbooboo]QAX94748.1 hypothetical protein SEA_LILBOOBOO_49 [Streptomyces phage Lilbooboo]